jgi:hypothetical protein
VVLELSGNPQWSVSRSLRKRKGRVLVGEQSANLRLRDRSPAHHRKDRRCYSQIYHLAGQEPDICVRLPPGPDAGIESTK